MIGSRPARWPRRFAQAIQFTDRQLTDQLIGQPHKLLYLRGKHMRGTAVQFGAGNIGRGFIAQLFHESGLDIVFVDVAQPVVAALNERRRYTIHVVGDGAHDVHVCGVRAIDGRDSDAVAAAIAQAEIVCTAVGVAALPYIAPNLAAGLLLRRERNGTPLDVLICENLHGAAERLRCLVSDFLPHASRDEVLARTGYVQAVVSRMVPSQETSASMAETEPLGVRVEAYKRLPVDAAAIVGPLGAVAGVEPVANFQAHVERKLYTHNCAHATLGYLGWRHGCEYGYEALVHPKVRPLLDAVLAETGEGLMRKHGFDPAEHAAHVDDLLRRFANRDLGDRCYRLARDPMRKLAPDDRVVGAARLCQSQGVDPIALPAVIAAALRFDAPDDPVAVALQRRISDEGIGAVLQDVCRINPVEPLGRRTLAMYEAQ